MELENLTRSQKELVSYKMKIASNVNSLSTLCNGLSTDAGWWKGNEEPSIECLAVKLCLVHSEVSEALEGLRKGLQDDHLPERKMFEVELADVLIRVFDLAGQLDMDLGGAMVDKLLYNQQRADHKLENREKENGKKF
jgi:hypothetical protein